jgi:endo-1,4-beta-xylanase
MAVGLNRRRFLKCAGAIAAAAGASAIGLDILANKNTGPAAPATSLRAIAESRGLLVGSAAGTGEPYQETLAREFNYLTPANETQWYSISQHGYGPADRLVDFALANKMKVKGHSLLCDSAGLSWYMDWIYQLSADNLRATVQKHIQEEVGRYKGKVYAWNVVNEAVDDTQGLGQTIFLKKLGDGYIADAFRIAHEADPNALLMYNDYGAEGVNAGNNFKSDRVYAFVKKLLADGVPIHGVGLQMHDSATVYPDPAGVEANVRRLTALGLKVDISEMDIRIHDAPGAMSEKLELQRKVYHDIIAACVKVEGFMGVTFWGFTDAFSWIAKGESGYSTDDAPCIFDAQCNPKPAYYGVLEALSGN